MNEVLKPCPFCQSNDVLPRTPGTGRYQHYIECDGCGSEGPGAYTEAEAIWAWNTPTIPSVEDIRREAFEEAAKVADKYAEDVWGMTEEEAAACNIATAIRAKAKEPSR